MVDDHEDDEVREERNARLQAENAALKAENAKLKADIQWLRDTGDGDVLDALRKRGSDAFEATVVKLGVVDRSNLPDVSASLSSRAVALIQNLRGYHDGMHRLRRVLLMKVPPPSGERVSQDDNEAPYRGLEPFEYKNAPFFYGRSSEVAELVESTAKHAVVAVVGASGTGKSSVVRAGLLPGLKKSGRSHETAIMKPGRNPQQNLVYALDSVGQTAGGASPPVPQASALKSDDSLLSCFLRRRHDAGGCLLLLVVDQWEELYTQASDAARDAFVTALVGAVDDGVLRCVITVRSDFYHRLLEHDGLWHRLHSSPDAVVPIHPIATKQLREVILEPAKRWGLEVDEALVERLIADFEDAPGQLPLLQFVLLKLWQHRWGDRLSMEVYEQLGGLKGALEKYADTVFDVLSKKSATHAEHAKAVFLALVKPGRGEKDTRRRELLSSFDEDERAVIRDLAGGDLRLVVITGTAVDGPGDSAEPGEREASVELAHETLIEHWPRLKRWVNTHRLASEARDDAIRAAELWESRGRDDDLLPVGHLLAYYATAPEKGPHRAFLTAAQEHARRLVWRSRLERLGVGVGVLLVLFVFAAGFFYQRHAWRETMFDEDATPSKRESALRGLMRWPLPGVRLELVKNWESPAKLNDVVIKDPNLNKANLMYAELVDAELERAQMEGVILLGANLRDAKLTGALLQKANLESADLQRANLEGANLEGANLQKAKAKLEVNLRDATLTGADLRGADLRGADLQGSDLQGADLQGADLRGVDLRGVKNLKGESLRHAIYDDETRWPGGSPPERSRAIGPNAQLEGEVLEGFDLSGVDFAFADLRRAKLKDAELKDNDLTRARLVGVNFEGADLRGADLSRGTISLGHEKKSVGVLAEEFDFASADRGRWTFPLDHEKKSIGASSVKAIRHTHQGAPSWGGVLSEARLEGAKLQGANLTMTDLSKANLADANLEGATLRGATLTNATLTNANLKEADLRGADFEGAKLTGAELRMSYLIGAELRTHELKTGRTTPRRMTPSELKKAFAGATLPDGTHCDDVPDDATPQDWERYLTPKPKAESP